MKKIMKCCLALALAFAVAGCSKGSSRGSGGGGSSSGDGGHKKVQLWKDGPYWAETNIGAEKPWDYGYYFWWGDTIGYKRVNDAWVASDGSSTNFSFETMTTPTYEMEDSSLEKEGYITKNGDLAPKHDAAHVHWGGKWRMPTPRDLGELCEMCDWTWTTTNGVNGYVVRGRGEYASASIFLPAGGCGSGTSLRIAGSEGGYWTSILDFLDDGRAFRLFFSSSNHDADDGHSRCLGLSIRPVQGFADLDGSNGTSLGGKAQSQVGAHQNVQLWKDGPYWAETNIGAEKPWESGFYFWWGDTIGYKRVNDAWVSSDGSSSNFSFTSLTTPTKEKDDSALRKEGWITAEGVLAPKHDAAHVHWGGEWRMPTHQEMSNLCVKCDWIWTTTNGVNGYVVRGKDNYASASIFLPAAGVGLSDLLDEAGSLGFYWLSVPSSESSHAWCLTFNLSSFDANDGFGRNCGWPIRPVQGPTK